MYTTESKWNGIGPVTRGHLETIYYYLQRNYSTISAALKQSELEEATLSPHRSVRPFS